MSPCFLVNVTFKFIVSDNVRKHIVTHIVPGRYDCYVRLGYVTISVIPFPIVCNFYKILKAKYLHSINRFQFQHGLNPSCIIQQ